MLSETGVPELKEIPKALELYNVDCDSCVTKMRKILEKIVQFLYKEIEPETSQTKLVNMIKELHDRDIISKDITTHMHSIRIFGNTGAHDTVENVRAVKPILQAFLVVVEWFMTRLLGHEVHINLKLDQELDNPVPLQEEEIAGRKMISHNILTTAQLLLAHLRDHWKEMTMPGSKAESWRQKARDYCDTITSGTGDPQIERACAGIKSNVYSLKGNLLNLVTRNRINTDNSTQAKFILAHLQEHYEFE